MKAVQLDGDRGAEDVVEIVRTANGRLWVRTAGGSWGISAEPVGEHILAELPIVGASYLPTMQADGAVIFATDRPAAGDEGDL